MTYNATHHSNKEWLLLVGFEVPYFYSYLFLRTFLTFILFHILKWKNKIKKTSFTMNPIYENFSIKIVLAHYKLMQGAFSAPV